METSCEIDVVYQEYDCSTPEDVSELFRRFDNHQARTLSDCLNPEAVALGIDWKRSIVRLVVTAAYLKENLAGLSGLTPQEELASQILFDSHTPESSVVLASSAHLKSVGQGLQTTGTAFTQ